MVITIKLMLERIANIRAQFYWTKMKNSSLSSSSSAIIITLVRVPSSIISAYMVPVILLQINFDRGRGGGGGGKRCSPYRLSIFYFFCSCMW